MNPGPIVGAQGVAFSYPALAVDTPPPPVLQDASFSVHPGECLAVMGANGSGKTTLCRLLSALAPQMTGGELRGELNVLGCEVRTLRPADLAGRVGITFQEVEHQLFNATVEAELAWGLEALGLDPELISERIGWALDVVGLTVDLERSPALLSGGQQRRLALAVALATRPRLLVLDEPLGGLDPIGTREVLEALAALRQETSAAIVITESMPSAALTIAGRVAVLADGRIAVEGAPREVFAHVALMDELGIEVPPLVRLASQLRDSLGTDLFFSMDEAEPVLRSLLAAHRPEELNLPEPGSAGPIGDTARPAVLYERVSFAYPDGPPVLQDLDLTIPAGQWVAVVGPNGSGKTTLAKHCNGLLRPAAGRVLVHGQDAARLSVGQLAREVGYLFQHPERQIFAATVRDELAFGPQNVLKGAKDPSQQVKTRVVAALERFGLTDWADSPPAVLSYALRRLVTLASVAAMEPSVLVLDEPTVGLDARGRSITLSWCRQARDSGTTVLLITHDMTAAAQADRIVVLESGQVIGDAPPAAIFAQEDLLRRASLESPPLHALAQRLSLPAVFLDETSLSRWLIGPAAGATSP